MFIGLGTSAVAAISGVISFLWEGLDMNQMIFGIWPLGAFLLALSIVSFSFFLAFAKPACSAINNSIRKRQIEKSHAALDIVWKYRRALDKSSSLRGLAKVEIYNEQLKKLKIMREDAVTSLKDLDEHIESIAPYLEEWPLSRVQKEVATWYQSKETKHGLETNA